MSGNDPGGDRAVTNRLLHVVMKDDIRFYGPAKYAIFIVGWHRTVKLGSVVYGCAIPQFCGVWENE